jgi:hypothetical protein
MTDNEPTIKSTTQEMPTDPGRKTGPTTAPVLMDVSEFVALGLLQEVNREFFHPRGLALEVCADKDGTHRITGVQDHRDKPGGYTYAEGVLSFAKAMQAQQLMAERALERLRRYRFQTQPIPTFSQSDNDDLNDPTIP